MFSAMGTAWKSTHELRAVARSRFKVQDSKVKIGTAVQMKVHSTAIVN